MMAMEPGFLRRKDAEHHSTDKCEENTKLSGRTEQKALRICNQGAEVSHGTDAEENKRRINAEFDALIQIIEQTAVCGGSDNTPVH